MKHPITVGLAEKTGPYMTFVNCEVNGIPVDFRGFRIVSICQSSRHGFEDIRIVIDRESSTIRFIDIESDDGSGNDFR